MYESISTPLKVQTGTFFICNPPSLPEYTAACKPSDTIRISFDAKKTLFTRPVGGSLGKSRQDSGSSRRGFWTAADLALAECLGREKENAVWVQKGEPAPVCKAVQDLPTVLTSYNLKTKWTRERC